MLWKKQRLTLGLAASLGLLLLAVPLVFFHETLHREAGWWRIAEQLGTYAGIALLAVMAGGSVIWVISRRLRESRARLAGIIDSAMDAIISVDASQRIVVFNAAAERMFRCPAAEAIGSPLERFIPERFRPAHRAHIQAFSQTGVTARALGHLQPLVALRADGEEFPIEASISQTEAGGQKLFTVILRDISERRAAEERIRSLNLELEQRVADRTAELTAANRELESFACSVAHDLRAPLRHIETFSQMLETEHAGVLPAEARSCLATIRQSARSMSRLLDNLLHLSRLGRQELGRCLVPLGAIVGQARDDLASETAGRNLEWRIAPLPTANCDPGLMKQVFANLLANALKYSRPRSPAVIEVGCCQADGATAIFVRDNGVGFDMEHADKLFGVFQRLHPPSQFEGTGVGLAIVDLIIRKHGGRVWAESEPDRGATFYFTLGGLDRCG